MRSLREVAGFPVLSPKGRRIGRVGDALFHPKRNLVIGYVVERPRLFLLFDRKDRYVALDGTKVSGREVTVTGGRDSWGAPAARRLGVSWDDSVIWMGMPARSASGAAMGKVRDALFDPTNGELEAVGLTGGLAADVAVGVRDLPAELVVGFDGEAVVFSDEAEATSTTGGAAAAAGRGSAVAKDAIGDATKGAADAAKTAAAYGAAAARVAARSKVGRKTAGWLKNVKDELVDAMGDPEDDE